MDTPAPPPIEIALGPDQAQGTYSNVVFIAHSPAEVILDFARLMPGVPKAHVVSRVIMTPQAAKGLLGALEQNIRNYEAAHGPIKHTGETPRGKEMGFTS